MDSTKTQKELLKGPYFLATRGITVSYITTEFYINRIASQSLTGNLLGYCQYLEGNSKTNWSDQECTDPVRAIVTLNPDLKTKDIVYPGDETGWNII